MTKKSQNSVIPIAKRTASFNSTFCLNRKATERKRKGGEREHDRMSKVYKLMPSARLTIGENSNGKWINSLPAFSDQIDKNILRKLREPLAKARQKRADGNQNQLRKN